MAIVGIGSTERESTGAGKFFVGRLSIFSFRGLEAMKKKLGRPPVYDMPELIPDTPENVARIFMGSPPTPPGGWQFLKKKKARAKKKAKQ